MRTYRELFEESRSLAGEWSAASRELARSSDERSTAYAMLVVQSLIIIHGGALVAIPSWWPQLVPHSGGPSPYLAGAVIAFILGLLAAVLSGVCGFVSLASRSAAFDGRAGEATDRAWKHLYQMEKMQAASAEEAKHLDGRIADAEQLASTKDTAVNKDNAKFSKFQSWGVGLGLFSVVMFIVGTAVAMASALRPILGP